MLKIRRNYTTRDAKHLNAFTYYLGVFPAKIQILNFIRLFCNILSKTEEKMKRAKEMRGNFSWKFILSWSMLLNFLGVSCTFYR